MSFPTIESGGSVSSTAWTTDERQQSAVDGSQTGDGTFHTMGAPESDAAPQASPGKPRIILESAAGHRIVLTYEDLVLIALLLGLGVTAVGWFR